MNIRIISSRFISVRCVYSGIGTRALISISDSSRPGRYGKYKSFCVFVSLPLSMSVTIAVSLVFPCKWHFCMCTYRCRKKNKRQRNEERKIIFSSAECRNNTHWLCSVVYRFCLLFPFSCWLMFTCECVLSMQNYSMNKWKLAKPNAPCIFIICIECWNTTRDRVTTDLRHNIVTNNIVKRFRATFIREYAGLCNSERRDVCVRILYMVAASLYRRLT